MSLRKRLNCIVLALAFTFSLATVSSYVDAIGLTPGRTTLDFEPGIEKMITFNIINNEHKEFNALVYVEGDMKDSVIMEKTVIDFKETDNSKEFKFKFRMPEKMNTPGDYWTKIIVMEVPAGMEVKKLEGQFVIATTAVVHQIRVKVPYPGKYVSLELAINEAGPGETTTFITKIINLGTEKVYGAYTTIDILGPTNEKIDTIESNSISIEPKTTGEIILTWTAKVNPGIYHAVATVNYDGRVAKVEKNFAVGALSLDIIDVKVRNFVLGEIAKFEINVENKWNQKIPSVYAEMIISDNKGNHIASIKTASVDVEAMQKATLYAYWDTAGVEKGTYDARLILHYAEKTTEKLLKAYVSLESIETEIVGITARAVTAKGGPGPGADYLVHLVVILIFINIGWFFYFRRRKK